MTLDALLSKYWGSPENFEAAIRARLAKRKTTTLFPNQDYEQENKTSEDQNHSD